MVHVGGKLQDHKWLTVTITGAVAETVSLKREVWNYRDGDWHLLDDLLDEHDWNTIRSMTSDEGATFLTESILNSEECAIGKRVLNEMKSTHPWLTEEVEAAIAAKNNAEGTDQESAKSIECSRIIMIAKENYIYRTRQELRDMNGQPKQWWKQNECVRRGSFEDVQYSRIEK